MLVTTVHGAEPVLPGTVFLPHPLLPVREVYAVAHDPVDDPEAGTRPWITALESASVPLVVLDDPVFQDDVWAQDMFRFAVVRDGGSPRPVVIASPRSAEIGVARAGHVAGRDPALSLVTVDMDGWSNLEGFGNFVVSPPIEGYPEGRVLFGAYGSHHPHASLLELLSPRQSPAAVDLQFLDVGHADEVFAFVADATAPRGFRVLVPDPRLAMQLLDEAPDTPLPHYGGSDRFGFALPSVGVLRSHPAIRSYNREIAAELDRAIAEATSHLQLQPEELIGLPLLFHENGDALADMVGASALTPNLVNGTWLHTADGRSILVVPDPHLRPAGAPLADDPFVRATEACLPDGIEVVWVDVWRSLHVNGGELHCATAIRYETSP